MRHDHAWLKLCQQNTNYWRNDEAWFFYIFCLRPFICHQDDLFELIPFIFIGSGILTQRFKPSSWWIMKKLVTTANKLFVCEKLFNNSDIIGYHMKCYLVSVGLNSWTVFCLSLALDLLGLFMWPQCRPGKKNFKCFM